MPKCAATVLREACSIRRSTPVVLQDVFKTNQLVGSTTIYHRYLDLLDLLLWGSRGSAHAADLQRSVQLSKKILDGILHFQSKPRTCFCEIIDDILGEYARHCANLFTTCSTSMQIPWCILNKWWKGVSWSCVLSSESWKLLGMPTEITYKSTRNFPWTATCLTPSYLCFEGHKNSFSTSHHINSVPLKFRGRWWHTSVVSQLPRISD